MKKIVFVTNTPGKVKEAQQILGKEFSVELVKFDLDEIQAIDGKDVAGKKAQEAYKTLKKPVLVDDTSLYFDAWNGLPGALARWFIDALGCEGICRLMEGEKNRKAFAESAFAFYDGKKLRVASAKVEGRVPLKPRGEHGFGWDPIFIPKGFKKTFAETTMEEKNRISMRKLALEKLRNHLVNHS